MPKRNYPHTPDGRYFVARGRLWRCSDPGLDEAQRKHWVSELMSARRAVKDAESAAKVAAARERVHAAKVALGERGPVWWNDGTADESRRKPKNSRYADWWAGLAEPEREAGR